MEFDSVYQEKVWDYIKRKIDYNDAEIEKFDKYTLRLIYENGDIRTFRYSWNHVIEKSSLLD